jgi:hypothetical protein
MASLPSHMKYVLAAGAAGGFVSWVYSETVGTKLALPAAAAIGACFVLGAAAALISVYVVANSDVNNTPRLIAFAVICGIFWKPVLDSSVTYVNQKRDASKSEERSDAALRSLKNTPQTAQPAAVAAATEATTDLLRTSNRLKDPELEAKARTSAKELIEAISAKDNTNPTVAVAALTEVREAAVATGNDGLATLASTEIRKLEPSSQLQLQQFRLPATNPRTEFAVERASTSTTSSTGTEAATST